MSDQRRPLSLSYVLALATVAVAPNQYLGTITRAGLRLTPADVMLGLTLVVFVVESWRRRSRISWPPAVLWALVGVAAASVLASAGGTIRSARPQWIAAGVRETAQLVEWFLVGYIVFRNLFDSPRRARSAAWALAGVTAALAAFALWQRFAFEEPGRVSATFGTVGHRDFHPSRCAYGAYLAVSLPVVLGLLGSAGSRAQGAARWRLPAVLALLAIIACGLATVTSSGALLAILVGLLATLAASGRRSPAMAAAVAAVVLGAMPWVLSGSGGSGGSGSSGGIDVKELGNFSQGGGVKRLYSEWQAGLNMLEWHFPTGVGLGNYQPNIYVYYFGLPYDARLEPDSLNGYLVLASTGGWLALVALMAALVYFGGLAARASRSLADPRSSALAAGLAGALAGFVVAQIYSSLLVRGTGLVIGLIVALIAVLASEEQGSHAAETASSNS